MQKNTNRQPPRRDDASVLTSSPLRRGNKPLAVIAQRPHHIVHNTAEAINVISGKHFLLSIFLVLWSNCAMLTNNRAAQDDWTEPFPAFRIAGNLYYVGSKGLASYLIATPQGHILINSDMEENVPLIRASVEKLGFKFSDIKILLISHAHWDHNAAGETIKKLTGAKYMVMDADVSVVESGGKTDFQYGNDRQPFYKPT